MNKRTLRVLLKASHAVNVLLLLSILIDFSLNASAQMLLLVGIYVAFLLWLVVLLAIDGRSAWVRAEFEEPTTESRTITYGRP